MEMIHKRPELELPGFRFHPTDEELLDYYLKDTVLGKTSYFDVVGFLNIYHHDPWHLPGLAKIGEREWHFLVPRERNGGGKATRTTESGYWKATGSDRSIRCMKEPRKILGYKKILVFYHGKTPSGCRTDWVMNEYRLPDKLDDIVLCKVYRKAISMKVLEQRAVAKVTMASYYETSSCSPMDTISFHEQRNDLINLPLFLQEEDMAVSEKVWNNIEPHSISETSMQTHVKLASLERPKTFGLVSMSSFSKAACRPNDYPSSLDALASNCNSFNSPCVKVGHKMENPTELQFPKEKVNGDCNSETFWSQLRSPWLDIWNATW